MCSKESERSAFIALMEEDSESFHRVLHSPHVLQAVLESSYHNASVDFHISSYVGISRLLLQRGVDSASLADYLTAMLGKFLFEIDWASTEFSRPATYVHRISEAISSEHKSGDISAALKLEIHLANYCLFVSSVMFRTLGSLELGLSEDDRGEIISNLAGMAQKRFMSASFVDKAIPSVYSTIFERFEEVYDTLYCFVDSPFA